MREKAQKFLKRAEEIANNKTSSTIASYSRPASAAGALTTTSKTSTVSIPITRISSARPSVAHSTPKPPSPLLNNELSTLTLKSTASVNETSAIASLSTKNTKILLN